MKLKEFFTKLKDQGGISNEDYLKFLETVTDGEIPDSVLPAIEEKFMTKERALSDKEITSNIWRKALDPIDNDIKEILKYLPAERVIEIEKAESTFKKFAAIRSAIPEAIQKASKNAPIDEDTKKKIHEKEAIIQDLMSKIEKANNEYSEKEKTISKDWEDKFKNYKLDSELEKLANSFTFADAYKDSRPALTKALLGEIKQKNKLDLVEKDGSQIIQVLDDNGAPRFNGNTAVTINSLLEEPFKPFLKQNNADTGGSGQHQATQQFRVESPTKTRTGARTEVSL